jgi:hypothetical protein
VLNTTNVFNPYRYSDLVVWKKKKELYPFSSKPFLFGLNKPVPPLQGFPGSVFCTQGEGEQRPKPWVIN